MQRRRHREYEDEPIEMEAVLEPYDQQWQGEESGVPYEEYEEAGFQPPYEYEEEYSEEHEALDHESRFRFAVGMMDIISILVGIAVILVMVAMVVSLVDWLQSDIMHSMLLFSSELQ